MKILVIWRLLTVGGVNAGWRNRAIHFKKYGIETEFLYTKDHGGLHIMEDVAKVYLTKNKKEIVQIIKENHYDVIIVVDTAPAYEWLQEARYKGPVLVEARTPELKKLIRHLKSFEGIRPRAIIVPSNYQKRLVSILTDGIPIHLIYNGVETSFYQALSKEEIHFHKDPILRDGKKIIGWIGRLDKRKNWQMLMEIAKKVKETRKDIRFWVIGGAQSVQRDEFAKKRLEEGLDDIIDWYPVIPYQDMPHMYAKIRESGGCTLATTKTESFGNTFIESMVCGVPVVAPNMMPMSEIIKDGETGLLYTQNKTDDCLKKLYQILDDQALHEKMSNAAIQHVKEHFTIEKVAKEYIQLLQSLFLHPTGERGNGS